jgi:putative adhesin
MRLTRAVLTAGATVMFVAAAASAQNHDVQSLRDSMRESIREMARSYQGRDRGPEQTDRFSAKYKISRDGRVSIANISGDISVTGGSGDEVVVDAIKRTRGDRSRLADVHIDVSNSPNRVDIRTDYPRMSNANVSVDYTVSVPNGVSIDLHSVSGSVKVTGVRGTVRAETVSGQVTASDTPNVELAKTVSGDVLLSGISTEGNLSAGSVSGNVTARGLKARRLEFSSVSGDVILNDVTSSSVHAKSVSGGFEYSGTILRNGEYEVNVHSGTIRFTLSNPSGFYLNADTFSGSIRTDFPVTIGGTGSRETDDRRRRRGVNGQSIHGVNGDGSATLTLRTFSGNIVIAKR